MNISQRLNQLESRTSPAGSQEPLLVAFIDADPETGKVVANEGTLYVYDGVPATQYELDKDQIAEYRATETKQARELFISNLKATV